MSEIEKISEELAEYNVPDELIGRIERSLELSPDKMVKTLDQTFKDESKKLKIPTDIRPYDIGYRVISKDGNILASRNGASVFSLPSEAKKAIQREFRKDNPDFDIEKYRVEEVAIVNFEKLKNFFAGG